jgi:hypothetical protein
VVQEYYRSTCNGPGVVHRYSDTGVVQGYRVQE